MNLILCRTPFQARLILTYLKLNLIETNFDLIYCTDNNSKIDQCYFQKLKSMSSVNRYVVFKSFRNDFVTQVVLSYKLWRLTRKNYYESVYIASLDIYYFKKIACNATKIIVFDDGSGSIISNESKLIKDLFCKYIYLNFLWRIPNNEEFMNIVTKFFTIYSTPQPDSLLYLCPDYKIQLIEVFRLSTINPIKSRPSINIFIGTNFYNYSNDIFIRKVKQYITSQNIDLYLPHPQERTPLINNDFVFHDKTSISEDIIDLLSEYYEINLFSCFSTVIFNVHGLVSHLNLVLDSKSEYVENYINASKSLNCSKIYL